MLKKIDESPAHRETELKLEIAPAARDRLVAAVRAIGEPVPAVLLTSVYFDTPRLALRKAGLTLRVRHDGARRIQTVKAEGVGAGLFDRPEWEFDIGGDSPEFGADRSPVGKTIGKKARRQVMPVFRTIVSRTKTVADIAGAAIELVIDEGEITAGDDAVAVCELELELLHGPVAGLFALARQVGEAGSVRLGVLSKSERGYRLLGARATGAVKAETVDLHRDMTAVAAFRVIAWSCLRYFRLNEDVLLATGDADALHQARVALRRLRSAFSLFKSVIGDDEADRLRGELRWLAGVLGAARDIDVLLPRARAAALRTRLRSARKRAYKTVGDALGSPRARILMLDLAEWLTLGPEWLTLGAEAPARHDEPMAIDFAADRLRRLRKRLKKNAAGFETLPDDERHEIRIEAKKLRYATEFFASLFHGEKAAKRHRKFRKRLEAFQVILGDLNDQVTGRLVVERLRLGDVAPEAWLPPADRGDLIGEAVVAYRSLLGARRFW